MITQRRDVVGSSVILAATEECVYCGRKYCAEHSINHELERHGNKT